MKSRLERRLSISALPISGCALTSILEPFAVTLTALNRITYTTLGCAFH